MRATSAPLSGSAEADDVDRLFGYLAERIFSVYLAHRAEACRRFSVESRPMLLAA